MTSSLRVSALSSVKCSHDTSRYWLKEVLHEKVPSLAHSLTLLSIKVSILDDFLAIQRWASRAQWERWCT